MSSESNIKKIKKETNLFQRINEFDLFNLLKRLYTARNSFHHEEIAKKIIHDAKDTKFYNEVNEILSEY